MRTRNVTRSDLQGGPGSLPPPCHPSKLVRPVPVPTTAYAVTVGRVTGVFPDVRLLNLTEVASQARFSMTTFRTWDEAVAFYTDQYALGNVYTTGSGDTPESPMHVAQSAPNGGPTGLVRRNDSFSRMGTPTPAPTSSSSRAIPLGSKIVPLGFKPSKSSAASRVKKAARSPNGERLPSELEVVEITDDEGNDSSWDGLIISCKPKPKQQASGARAPAPFPLKVAAPVPGVAPAPAPAAPFQATVVPFPGAATSSAVPFAGAAAPATQSAAPVTPPRKRRYIAFYIDGGVDFDDPAFLARMIQSTSRTPVGEAAVMAAVPAAAQPASQATFGPNSNGDPVTPASSVPNSTRGPVARASSVPLDVFHSPSKKAEGKKRAFDPEIPAADSQPGSPSGLSDASDDIERQLGYEPMDASLLESLP